MTPSAPAEAGWKAVESAPSRPVSVERTTSTRVGEAAAMPSIFKAGTEDTGGDGIGVWTVVPWMRTSSAWKQLTEPANGNVKVD